MHVDLARANPSSRIVELHVRMLGEQRHRHCGLSGNVDVEYLVASYVDGNRLLLAPCLILDNRDQQATVADR